MKHIFYFLLFVTFSVNGQIYTGPIPKPTSGYGVDGSYTVATHSFANPNFPGHDIVIYYPTGITLPVPTLFYSHAFGGNDPDNISGFLNFVAKKVFLAGLKRNESVGL